MQVHDGRLDGVRGIEEALELTGLGIDVGPFGRATNKAFAPPPFCRAAGLISLPGVQRVTRRKGKLVAHIHTTPPAS
eukprot:366520-Chlamydomonas_euryale.AAC.24